MDDVDLGRTIERLRGAAASMTATRSAIEAGRPWPLHIVEHDAGPESTWGPTEVLAHVAEMLAYWLGEIERIIDGASEPVPFGRTAADRLRVMTIERDRMLPPRELLDRVENAVERYARRSATLGASELNRHGLHPTLGEMTVAEILERFVVSHAEGHVVQLAETLGASSEG
jgi:DinB family protein